MPALSPPARVDPKAPAAIFFTSGTTGVPKGAVLPRRALIAAAEASARNLGWQPEDRWLLTIPLAHIGGFSILTRCLLARRPVVVGGADADLARTVGKHQVTIASLVPTHLRRALDASRDGAPAPLRAVLLGGAAAPEALRVEARSRGWPILATYGLTEACAQVATEQPGAEPMSGSVGRPLIEGSVMVRDGRIHVRGPTLMTGYLGQPPLPTDGWFDTGDLGSLDEQGRLRVRGRRSDLIVSGGENVYPQEVEDALRQLDDIEDAVVFGVEDPEWGQVVSAAVVVRSGATADIEAWTAALVVRLASFKRPRRWAVVDALPVNRAGKLDRAAARRAFGGLVKG